MYHGWLNVDKPENVSSADVIRILRKIFLMKKIGHAGTLDPMATGVLPIAFGEATKTIRFAQDLIKGYVFTVKFGSSTDSLDRLGNITDTTSIIPSLSQLHEVIPKFRGTIEQTPPKFSAIKINGVRAYKMARRGEEVKLQKRSVVIKELELIKYVESSYEAHFRVICSKGTYVRTLGDDIARTVGSLGHLVYLRRIKVGCFTEENIKSIEKIKEMVHNNKISLLSIGDAFQDVPFIDFSVQDKEKIKNGVSVSLSSKDKLGLDQKEAFARVGSSLIAIGRIDNNIFYPTRGFNFN